MSQNPGWKLSQRLRGWATSGHSSIIWANGSKSQRFLVGHIVSPVELVLHRCCTFFFRELKLLHTFILLNGKGSSNSWEKLGKEATFSLQHAREGTFDHKETTRKALLSNCSLQDGPIWHPTKFPLGTQHRYGEEAVASCLENIPSGPLLPSLLTLLLKTK